MPHLHHAALGSSRSSVLPTLILVLMELVYLRGWLSLRPGGVERISVRRAVSFFVGLFLIWAAVASPLAALDHELLTVHMLQHLLLMTLAPPLIWLGAPVGQVSHGLPRRFVESLLVPWWQSQAMKRLANALKTPKFAWLAACAALVGWHIPISFALGMRSASWHLFEHLSFLATGLLFWWPVVQPSAEASRQDLSMILYLFFATLPCGVLSGYLAFSDRVAYPIYLSSSHPLGLFLVVGQECAAALMWTCVTVLYLVAGTILTMRVLSPQDFRKVGLVQPKSRGPGIGQTVLASTISQGLESL